ncbi:MAG: helix-turn-helix transcriptional regulator [Chitinophagaceae bacterium]
MELKEYIPTAALKPYIRSFRIIESRSEVVNRVVPNTSFALAFRLKGSIAYINGEQKVELPSAAFSGLRRSVRLISYNADSAALIVLFTETGISAFFKEPLHELFEQSISLDHVLRQSEVQMIEERLADTGTNAERIKIVERFLLSKLIRNDADKLVQSAVADIYANNGMLKIKELSEKLYISQDAFEKRFRKTIGTSPKQFASIIRLKSITQKAAPTSLLDVAIENGYYDQAHFIKDFKLFTGLTPREFYRSGLFW